MEADCEKESPPHVHAKVDDRHSGYPCDLFSDLSETYLQCLDTSCIPLSASCCY